MKRLAVLLALCGCSEPPAPFGEAVIVVDTDVPVPKVASRLRIDLYDADGAWFDSRDIGLPDPADWPTSFSVFNDADDDKDVWVRLRAFPEGRVRDYRGERFWDWTEGTYVEPPPPPGEAPRLVRDGDDITPPSEPAPLTAIDRLLHVRLAPGRVGMIRATLRAVCAGTMARMTFDDAAASCDAVDKSRTQVRAITSLETLRPTSVSQQNALTRDCNAEATGDRVCIPGGATILGSSELSLYFEEPAVPERIVVHAPFLLDRHEVTVGRYRAAIADGFLASSSPNDNLGAFGVDVASSCSWSSIVLDREEHALTCVPWTVAREFCQWAGGDLPSEAQWEHAATLAIDGGRSRYPWGDEPPTCDRAIHGRIPLGGSPGVCQMLGAIPPPAGAAPDDITPQGVVGMGGGVQEWLSDSFLSYAFPCWQASPTTQPACQDAAAPLRSVRGGAWASPPTFLASAMRIGTDPLGRASFIGFRCAYPDEAP